MENKKVLFITGAGSGMGQLAAQRALDAGWAVAAMDINAAGLDNLRGEPAVLLKLVVDITDTLAVADAVQQAESTLGSIDRLINAAAIMPLGLLTDQTPALVLRIMAINYGGLVNITQAVLPRMLQRGRGEFISFASMAGHLPAIYMGAYNASKFAVYAFTEVLYHENRESGVRFLCVCPPVVATPLLRQAKDTVWPKLFDKGAAIQPQEVIDAIEPALQKGQFLLIPARGAYLSYVFRRLFPDLVWKMVHKVEGR